MSMMVVTILEARVEEERSSTLQAAYRKGIAQLPPQMVQTFLVQDVSDKETWKIISVWKSREALEEMRNSGETPGGVLMFRAAGAEPSLRVYDVRESSEV
jgi:quinol monooxygenase YgiN